MYQQNMVARTTSAKILLHAVVARLIFLMKSWQTKRMNDIVAIHETADNILVNDTASCHICYQCVHMRFDNYFSTQIISSYCLRHTNYYDYVYRLLLQLRHWKIPVEFVCSKMSLDKQAKYFESVLRQKSVVESHLYAQCSCTSSTTM